MMELSDANYRFLYKSLLVAIAIVTLIGYAIYGAAVWKNKKLFKKTIWISSLAVADTTLVLNLMAANYFIFNGSSRLGNFYGHVNALVSLFSGFAQISSVMWIAVDKYYQACKPEKFGVSYGFYVAQAWTLAFLTAAMPFLGFGAYDNVTGNTASCVIDLNNHEANRFYIILVALLWFAYPVLQTVIHNWKLLQESKNARMWKVLMPVIIFTLFYSPYAMYAGLKVTVGLSPPPLWFLVVIYILPKCITVSNPYIYILSEPDLLEASKNVLFGKKNTKTS